MDGQSGAAPNPPSIAMGAAERRLLRAAGEGSLVDLRVGEAPADNPAYGAKWGADRTVRASLLVELLTGELSPPNGRLRGVKLRGARITGALDLEAAELACPLLLTDCHIEKTINLGEATAPVIRLSGCVLPGLNAAQLRVTGGLALNNGFRATGKVNLSGAHIGQLDLAGARLTNPGGQALIADGLVVEQNMRCRDGFVAAGEVRLSGARIGGVLDFDGAQLNNPGGQALSANRLSVAGDLLCGGGFSAQGEIQLSGARIDGELSFDAAALAHPNGRALSAERLTVNRDMVCRRGFTADGEIRILRSHIGGFLDLEGARLINPGKAALYADGLIVEQAVACRDGFTAEGEVSLVDAHFGSLDLSGATLTNPGGQALIALRLTIDQNMFCRYGFSAEGAIRLFGAHIGNRLNFIDASLINADGIVLDLERANVGTLILQPRQRPVGGVDLTNARVGSYSDNPASRPETVFLRGFSYDTIENDEVDVRARLRWLTAGQVAMPPEYYDQLSAAYRHAGREEMTREVPNIKQRILTHSPSGYVPQVYDQLAAAYRRNGREEAARQVAIAKQWRRRQALNPLGKLWNWLLYVTVGYGYRTWLAAIWLIALLALGAWAFDSAYPSHIVQTEPQPLAFHAFAYTLDVLLPLGDLGQQQAWHPQGAAMYWTWAFTAAGWILTTAVVAGLTRNLKRD